MHPSDRRWVLIVGGSLRYTFREKPQLCHRTTHVCIVGLDENHQQREVWVSAYQTFTLVDPPE